MSYNLKRRENRVSLVNIIVILNETKLLEGKS